MSDNSYLSDLQLFRNDPGLVEKVIGKARDGEADAQYALGLIFAEGRGVPINLAEAHYWLSCAIAQGDRDADLLRNLVGCEMSQQDYDQAVQLAKTRGLGFSCNG